MKHIGIFEAKTRFSEIAKRVKETGQPIRVTSHGEEMVDIMPIAPRIAGRRTKAQAIAELEELRKTLPKTSMKEIQADIAFGRR
jgi:prevent-host-death family protein